MDKTKLKVLREVGYTFPKTCGMCAAGQFEGYRGMWPLWGTCGRQTYEHEKHTGEKRQLSIHLLGSCASFEAVSNAADALQGFGEFVP